MHENMINDESQPKLTESVQQSTQVVDEAPLHISQIHNSEWLVYSALW